MTLNRNWILRTNSTLPRLCLLSPSPGVHLVILYIFMRMCPVLSSKWIRQSWSWRGSKTRGQTDTETDGYEHRGGASKCSHSCTSRTRGQLTNDLPGAVERVGRRGIGRKRPFSWTEEAGFSCASSVAGHVHTENTLHPADELGRGFSYYKYFYSSKSILCLGPLNYQKAVITTERLSPTLER